MEPRHEPVVARRPAGDPGRVRHAHRLRRELGGEAAARRVVLAQRRLHRLDVQAAGGRAAAQRQARHLGGRGAQPALPLDLGHHRPGLHVRRRDQHRRRRRAHLHDQPLAAVRQLPDRHGHPARRRGRPRLAREQRQPQPHRHRAVRVRLVDDRRLGPRPQEPRLLAGRRGRNPPPLPGRDRVQGGRRRRRAGPPPPRRRPRRAPDVLRGPAAAVPRELGRRAGHLGLQVRVPRHDGPAEHHGRAVQRPRGPPGPRLRDRQAGVQRRGPRRVPRGRQRPHRARARPGSCRRTTPSTTP